VVHGKLARRTTKTTTCSYHDSTFWCGWDQYSWLRLEHCFLHFFAKNTLNTLLNTLRLSVLASVLLPWGRCRVAGQGWFRSERGYAGSLRALRAMEPTFFFFDWKQGVVLIMELVWAPRGL
jgi:hypothetical protein